MTKYLLPLFMSISANEYFGWNWSPHSDAEMVCDLIIFATMTIAWSKP